MKLELNYAKIVEIVNGKSLHTLTDMKIDSIAIDTRKIVNGNHTLFIALTGEFRDGHDFIENAYKTGVKNFIISKEIDLKNYPDANFILVENGLTALQQIAKTHRLRFNYPIVAITGSVGKTIVKEWLYHFLSPEKKIIRSPKSFNSQIGVALSLLELTPDADFGIIEMGISQVDEMKKLQEIVLPNYGIFTSIGSAHLENFNTIDELISEKIQAFSSCQETFYHDSISISSEQINQIHGKLVNEHILDPFISNIPFQDKITYHNISLVVAFTKSIGFSDEIIVNKLKSLPLLAMRMEVYEGINNNTIINDTYNLDLDALSFSLEHQFSLAQGKNRVLIISLFDLTDEKINQVKSIIEKYQPNEVFYYENQQIPEYKDSIILIKGSRKASMQKIASSFRLKKHKTIVEINLENIRSNLTFYKSHLKPATKILAMVKASSYGSGGEEIALFLEKQGVGYLGVAYADEGVELRKAGVQIPIMVMNAEEEGFGDCIQYNLEPAIYSFEQLDEFIKEIIFENKTDYPINLKIDTGMNRLGFNPSDLNRIIEILQAQPEVKIKSVYSHLADSDNLDDKSFTRNQIDIFQSVVNTLKANLDYSFLSHICNSEGILNFPEAQLDMVRIGIGMYGISSNPKMAKQLNPVLSWKSVVSQVKTIEQNETIGYNCSYLAKQQMQIAVIPVGYADGFRRTLSNGKGSVYIDNKKCPVVGKVCMDMIMVDVTNLNIKSGDTVEIIGNNKSIQTLAEEMETIPYEVMTGISKRVHRIYIGGL